MMSAMHNGLPRRWRTTIMPARVKYTTFMALSLLAHAAVAQRAPAAPEPKRDDLDVTMQIIVDPDAKLPDEVVRRIPLPERKSPASSASPSNQSQSQSKGADKQDQQNRNNAREAQEVGKEAGQSAKERAKEAKEQREQARRAEAEERRRRNENNPNRPPNPPGRPQRP